MLPHKKATDVSVLKSSWLFLLVRINTELKTENVVLFRCVSFLNYVLILVVTISQILSCKLFMELLEIINVLYYIPAFFPRDLLEDIVCLNQVMTRSLWRIKRWFSV